MVNLIRKIIYKLLTIQEKVLTFRLDKTLKRSFKNKTSKTIISSTEHVTLNAQTEINKELVRKNVEDIIRNTQNNPEKLIEFIEVSGTKVFKLKSRFLKLLNEEEGMIFELHGLKALLLNIITKSGISLKSKPIFIITDEKPDLILIIQQFYKWYAFRFNLPGFDYKAQQNFKKYMKNINDKSLNQLSMEDTLALTEAVNRDKEATAFALSFIQKGTKNANKKITEGGANI